MSAQPLEIRMAHLEGAYEQISERLRGIDGRFTALDQKVDSRFDRLDQKIGALDRKMDSRFETFEQKMDSRFDALDRKLTTMMVGSFGTSAALIAAIIGVIVSHH
jgi:predicted nuclease with TOPRIM domain